MRVGYTSGIMSLHISNATIDSTNGYGQFKIRGNVDIHDSTINNLGSGTMDDGGQRDWLFSYGANVGHFNLTNNIISNMNSGISVLEYIGVGNLIFNYNTVFNNRKTAVDFYSSGNRNAIIKNNNFMNNLNNGLTYYPTAAVVIPSFDAMVENNIIDGFGDGSATAVAGFCAKEKNGVTYFNNTIKNGIGASTGIRIYDTLSWGTGRVLAYQNTISNVETGLEPSSCLGSACFNGVGGAPSVYFHDNTVKRVKYGVYANSGQWLMNSVFANNIIEAYTTCFDIVNTFGYPYTNNSLNSNICNSVSPTVGTDSTMYINGTVMNNSIGIAGAVVTTNNSYDTTTNVSGFYSFQLPAGTYKLIVTSEPRFYPNNTVNVTVAAGMNVVQDIELVKKPTGNIIGSVSQGMIWYISIIGSVTTDPKYLSAIKISQGMIWFIISGKRYINITQKKIKPR